jgi:hypothetical protein
MIKQKRGKNGQFIPKFPEKYIGKYPIQMRSTWERRFARWLDKNPNVIEWSSESIAIPYYNPVYKKTKRYFPDFFMRMKNVEGDVKSFIVEIKPLKETRIPERGLKKAKTRIYEERTYLVNAAKWKAADIFCKKMGFEFKVITERELFE